MPQASTRKINLPAGLTFGLVGVAPIFSTSAATKGLFGDKITLAEPLRIAGFALLSLSCATKHATRYQRLCLALLDMQSEQP